MTIEQDNKFKDHGVQKEFDSWKMVFIPPAVSITR
jgi:hypothetical protein